MTDPTVVVGIAKIDSVTEQTFPRKLDHGIWAFQLPVTAAEATQQVLSQLPGAVKKLTSTVILASSQGDAHAKDRIFNAVHTENRSKVRPRDALVVTGATLPSIIMQEIPSSKDVFQIDMACASSLKALELAVQITQAKQELVLIAGIDFSAARYVLVGFNSLGAVAVDDVFNSPFDKNRSGFAIGEGAAAIAVCTESFAKEHGLDILATIDAVDTFSCCTHPTGPTDSTLLENFLRSVVKKSQKRIYDFAYWDAHATATPVGDSTEFDIFSSMFSNIPISSYKGHVGHCLSASGAIEIVNAIENLQKGMVPHTYNIVEPMNADPRIITSSQATDKKTFIKCSFGFAGRNGAAVITVS